MLRVYQCPTVRVARSTGPAAADPRGSDPQLVRVEDDEVEFAPGRYVFVPPEPTRQVVAGAEGLSYLVVGSRPGAYLPRGR